MNRLLSHTFRPTPDQIKAVFDDCLFFVDANILLHLAEHNDSEINKFLDYVKARHGRIFVTSHTAYEYAKDHDDVVISIINALRNGAKAFTNSDNVLKDSIKEIAFHNLDDKTRKEANKLIKDCYDQLTKLFSPVLTAKADALDKGTVAGKLAKAFDGCVLPTPDADTLRTRQADAKRRCDSKIRPGFRDNNKPENPFGDALMWFEILDKAKGESRRQGKPVNAILISNDVKDDWMMTPKDGKGAIVHPELTAEYRLHCGGIFLKMDYKAFMDYAEAQKSPTNIEADEKQREHQRFIDEMRKRTIERLSREWAHTFASHPLVGTAVPAMHHTPFDSLWPIGMLSQPTAVSAIADALKSQPIMGIPAEEVFENPIKAILKQQKENGQQHSDKGQK